MTSVSSFRSKNADIYTSLENQWRLLDVQFYTWKKKGHAIGCDTKDNNNSDN